MPVAEAAANTGSGRFGGVLVGASANAGGHVSVNRKITAQELAESGDGAGLVARTAEELAKLGEALEQTLGETRALNLLIDAAVSHGETMRWLERLQACGVGTVNLVATPEEAEADVPAAEH